MKTLRVSVSLVAALALAGCAVPGPIAATLAVTMMPRDSGDVYKGELYGDGTGGGSMSVNYGQSTCSGPAVRVAASEALAFVTTYSSDKSGQTTSTGVSNGPNSVGVKALLSCSNSKGLRCNMIGLNGRAAGICVDDADKAFDVIASLPVQPSKK